MWNIRYNIPRTSQKNSSCFKNNFLFIAFPEVGVEASEWLQYSATKHFYLSKCTCTLFGVLTSRGGVWRGRERRGAINFNKAAAWSGTFPARLCCARVIRTQKLSPFLPPRWKHICIQSWWWWWWWWWWWLVQRGYVHAATACLLRFQNKTTTTTKKKRSLLHSLSKCNSLRTGRSSGFS